MCLFSVNCSATLKMFGSLVSDPLIHINIFEVEVELHFEIFNSRSTSHLSRTEQQHLGLSPYEGPYGEAVPPHRLVVRLRHTLAVVEHDAEAVLRGRIALLGRAPAPLRGGLEVDLDACPRS